MNYFIEALGSKQSTPGGGSAAAITGAIGISLTQMVVSLTTGKPRYEAYQPLLDSVQEQASELTQRFVDGMQADIDAFNGVMEAYRIKATTDEEQVIKQARIEQASKQATVAPFEMMEASILALRLSKQLVGKSNPNVLSDLGVAALNLKATLQSSWLNVLINLKTIQDEVFVARYKEQGEQLLAEGKQLADELYNLVVIELS
ncbi:cyclodeaminase/cyclohydrolase family protein [Vagococcus xieshaowenii]